MGRPAPAAAILVVSLSSLGAASASERVPCPRLVVDYLPALVYENELVPLRFRVVNPCTSPIEGAVTLALHAGRDDPHRAESPGRVTVTVPGGEDRPVPFDIPSLGWATASVEFSAAGGRTETFWISHFGEDEDIPTLLARGERLYVAESGDVALLSLQQRASQPDRQWYLWKRLAERLAEGALPARLMVLGARLSPPGSSAHDDPGLPAYLAEVRARSPVPVIPVPLPGETDPCAFAPVLADLVTALGTFKDQEPCELVVWVVGCDDAGRATPLWTFRKAADFMLRRARRWGAGRLVVTFVPEPAVEPRRRALYAEQLRLAVNAYRGSFVRLSELEERRCWTVGGPAGPSRALGRYPNREGHSAIARAVLDRVRP